MFSPLWSIKKQITFYININVIINLYLPRFNIVNSIEPAVRLTLYESIEINI